MRLSDLVVAAVLLVSVTVLAQHSGGGSSSGGGGGSHGGSSAGGFSSSASSHVGSASSFGGSHSTGTASSASGRTDRGKVASGGVRSSGDNAQSSSVKPEKKGFFSLFRHKQPEPKFPVVAYFTPPGRCKKGQVCTCIGGGNLNTAGQCGFQPQVFACPAGWGWNGSACGAQYWSNDCRSLAEQLAAQRAQMRGQYDYGQSLRYRLLQQQYQQCLMRSRFAFGAYAFNAFLLDAP